MQSGRLILSLLSFWILILNVTALPSSQQIRQQYNSGHIFLTEGHTMAWAVVNKPAGIPSSDLGKKYDPFQQIYHSGNAAFHFTRENISFRHSSGQQYVAAAHARPLTIMNCQYRK